MEFKSSLRYDLKTKQVNEKLEYVVSKTIDGFMNSEGGKLFIGVDDEGNILGIEDDYSTLGKKQNRDGFLLKLTEVVQKHLGTAYNQYLSIKIEQIDGADVCLVDVLQSDLPVFLKCDGQEEFFIRASASTQPLRMSEANDCISIHWSSK